jgi:hypothetical protein
VNHPLERCYVIWSREVEIREDALQFAHRQTTRFDFRTFLAVVEIDAVIVFGGGAVVRKALFTLGACLGGMPGEEPFSDFVCTHGIGTLLSRHLLRTHVAPLIDRATVIRGNSATITDFIGRLFALR